MSEETILHPPVCDDRGWHILLERKQDGFVSTQQYDYPDMDSAQAAYQALTRPRLDQSS